jgi:2-iminobutanoate/2-iminopropanoate deaminase
MSKEVTVPGDLISGAVKIGNILFTAGMTGGPGDTETQIRNTIKKLKETLEKSGTSLENVVKATVYLEDLEDRGKYLNQIWKETFPKDPPARTTIQAGLGGVIKVEIEAIAVIPEQY